MNSGIWVIVKNDRKTEIRKFKHRFIKYWLYLLINKIKKNKVEILNEKDK